MIPITFTDGDKSETFEVLVAFNTICDMGEVYFESVEPIEVVKLCDHCGNFRLDYKKLSTMEELVANEWIRKVD